MSSADNSGRLPVVYMLSLKAGFSTGPVLASHILNAGGFRLLVLIGMLMIAVVVGAMSVVFLSRPPGNDWCH